MITSICTGNNSDLIAQVMALHGKCGDRILDLTYGKGNFWKKINLSQYKLIANDLYEDSAKYHYDFRRTKFKEARFDIIVLDPPYMRTNNTAGIMQNLYQNQTINLRTHRDILNLYCDGIIEAKRLLKNDGLLFIKCQDETADHKQHWTHIELMDFLLAQKFLLVDLFILVRTGKAMKGGNHYNQRTARKMHSYLIVAQKTNRKQYVKR